MGTRGQARRAPSEIGPGCRRNAEEIAALDRVIINIVDQQRPMTVRSVFYQASAQGAVPKSEKYGYEAVQRRLTVLGEDGRVRMADIVDPTRPLEATPSYSSPRERAWTPWPRNTAKTSGIGQSLMCIWSVRKAP
jgi:hypothetical protein